MSVTILSKRESLERWLVLIVASVTLLFLVPADSRSFLGWAAGIGIAAWLVVHWLTSSHQPAQAASRQARTRSVSTN